MSVSDSLPPFDDDDYDRLDKAFRDLEAAWRDWKEPLPEPHLPDFALTSADGGKRIRFIINLIEADLDYRKKKNRRTDLQYYVDLFPELGSVENLNRWRRKVAGSSDSEMPTRPPSSGDAPEAAEVKVKKLPPDLEIGDRIGRYRIEAVLGKGAFGRVYLAYDDDLNRHVAVKVPLRAVEIDSELIRQFLKEARVVAGLDHPAIVPIFDFGVLADGRYYLVSKYIKGTNLADEIRQCGSSRVDWPKAAQMAATLADALEYAHAKGVIHRDVKPANILIDDTGKVHLTDFGLALSVDEARVNGDMAGTPLYMSPEQASGQPVDQRTDIFSLGAVLYELLCGKTHVAGGSIAQVIEQISRQPAAFPVEEKRRFPQKLQATVLKAMSIDRASRHDGAGQLAKELRDLLLAMKAVFAPKGLRSFDARDSDFFLQLLPGPYDESGLPVRLAFWKQRVEAKNPDESFTVGLIFGPSGCGKSSFVKAGLLPILAGNVKAIYCEASADDTERRLVKVLEKSCPGLADCASLQSQLAAARKVLPDGEKLLIVIDQFEQWLHANAINEQAPLIEALHECDGRRVQCLLLVRSDFWMPTVRFFHQLDIPLRSNENSAAVDLFDPQHARNVLWLFGSAYGRYEGRGKNALTETEIAFLNRAVEGLSESGWIICVRLALFAHLMRNREWVEESLVQVGGSRGVGLAYLEETFTSSTAPLEYRDHCRAARKVLKALLPPSTSGIKGRSRSRDELLDVSGCASDPRRFGDLLHILDNETRLVSPITESDEDETSANGADAQDHDTAPENRHYQLTHDYLVEPLREWLTREDRKSLGGRLRLLLDERAAAYQVDQHRRHYPSWLEHLGIRLLCRRRNWAADERKLMRSAGRFHGLWTVCFVILVAILVQKAVGAVGGFIQSLKSSAERRSSLIQEVADSHVGKLDDVVDRIRKEDTLTQEMLEKRYLEEKDEGKKLSIAVALIKLGRSGVVSELNSVWNDVGSPAWSDNEHDPSWSEMPQSIRDAIAGAGGMIADQFAFCTKLRSEEFESLRDDLNRAGYRPTCIRAVPVDGTLLFSVVWARDGREWTYAIGIADDIRKRDDQSRKEGFTPEDISGWSMVDDDASPKFLAIWVKAGKSLGQEPDSLLVCGVSQAELEKKVTDKFRTRGVRYASYSVVRDGNGVELCSAIVAGPDPSGVQNLSSQNERGENLHPGLLQLDAQYFPAVSLESLKSELVAKRTRRPKSAIDIPQETLEWAQSVYYACRCNEDELKDPGSESAIDLDTAASYLFTLIHRQQVRSGADLVQFAKWQTLLLAALRRTEGQQVAFQRFKDLSVEYGGSDVESFFVETASKMLLEPTQIDPFVAQVRQVYQEHANQKEWSIACARLYAMAGALANIQDSGGEVATEFFNEAWTILKSTMEKDAELYRILTNEPEFRGVWILPECDTFLREKSLGVSVAAAWGANEGFESTTISMPFDGDQFSEKCQNLITEGYRPARISAGNAVKGQLWVMAIWKRPLDVYYGPENEVLNRSEVAVRKANAAVLMFRAGERQAVSEALASANNPTLTSKVVHGMAKLDVPWAEIVRWLETEPNLVVQRNLVIALGDYDHSKLSNHDKGRIVSVVKTISNREAADSGVCSAAEWLMRNWDMSEVVPGPHAADTKGLRPQMASIRGGRFVMGSPGWEAGRDPDEVPHWVSIDRDFRMSVTHVTQAQFMTFLSDQDAKILNEAERRSEIAKQEDLIKRNVYPSDGRRGESPAVGVSWYLAAAYCNWLSQKEGIIELCYRRDQNFGAYASGMAPESDYLTRNGYRLPTEAEWEYACRAGVASSRYFGDDDTLLGKYAWYADNSENQVHPSGLRIPNRFGLFDMLGNVWTWCGDSAIVYGDNDTDAGDLSWVLDDQPRVLRGGALSSRSSQLRSAFRMSGEPLVTSASIGFRIVQTMPRSSKDDASASAETR